MTKHPTTMRPAVGVGLIGLLALLAGCEKAAPPPPAAPPKVSVMHAEARSIVDHDDYNGWIDSPNTVEVRARVRGHIDKVHFTDGQLVKKGDVLFDLDPRPFQEEIDRASEQVNIFQAQLNYALVEEKRMKEMRATGVSSAIEVESTAAKARSLEAQVEAQKKEVDRQKLDLEYAKVTAPIDGRIGRAMMTEGNLVNAGGSDPLLATITANNPMYVYFNVDERAIQRYAKAARPNATGPRTGELKELNIKFQFGLETDQGFPHEGIMDFADNRVDQTTGSIAVRGVVNNDKGLFLSGSRVRIRLAIGQAAPVLLVPDTAILTDQDRKYVLVLDDKNVVQRRDITLGRLMDDGIRVVLPNAKGAQLSADEWIVVQGLQMARLNYPVEPIKPSTTQPAQTASTGQ